MARMSSRCAQGKYDEADRLYARAISIGEKRPGPVHPVIAGWMENRAILLGKMVRKVLVSDVRH